MARFLALLELFREGAVAFEQVTPLGELTIRWTGSDAGELDISDEFDETATRRSRRRTRRDRPDRCPELGQSAAEPTERGPRTTGPRPSVSGAIEALLLLAEEPMPERSWPQAVGVPEPLVADALAELVAFYDETGRGFELRAGRRRLALLHPRGARRADRPLRARGAAVQLSQAALETLAVVAYQQPISRARVSAVRGVNVDGVMRTLLARGLVAEAGHDPESGAVRVRAPPATSWSGWGCAAWTTCRRSRRTCPRSTSWRPS